MDSVTVVISSSAYAQLFLSNLLSSLTNFLREGLKMACQLSLQLPKKPTHQSSIMLQRESACFFMKSLSTLSEIYYREPGLYHSDTNIVEVLNTLVLGPHYQNERWTAVKVSRKTLKVEICLAKNEGFGLPFFNTDLRFIFWGVVGYDFEKLLRRKWPQKQDFITHIVCIHVFMMYTDLTEYKIVGNTKAPLLRWFFIISNNQLRNWQHRNCCAFFTLYLKPLLKTSSHSVNFDWRNSCSTKVSFVSVGITRFALIFRKSSHKNFRQKTRPMMVASRQVDIPCYRGMSQQLGNSCLCRNYREKRTSNIAQINSPSCKTFVGADLLQFFQPEIAEVCSKGTTFKNAAHFVVRQTLKS